MNISLREQLRSPDPAQRRAAIIYLGRSGDQRALKALAHIAQHDSEPALRKLAKRAGQHIQHKQQATPSAPDAALENAALENATSAKVALKNAALKNAASSDTLSGGRAYSDTPLPDTLSKAAASESVSMDKPGAYTPPPPRPSSSQPSVAAYRPPSLGVRLLRRGVRLFAFTVVALLVTVSLAGGYLYIQGDLDRLLFDLNQAEAQSLPETPLAPREHRLEGALYTGQISPQMTFYVQEPTGSPPEKGWPMVVALYDGLGDDEDMLFWGRDIPSAGILLAVARLSPPEPNSAAYSGSAISQDLQTLITRLDAYYPLDPTGRVLLGYGLGGSAAGLHAVYNPTDFDGYVLLDADRYPETLVDSAALMLIMWTANNPNAEVGRDVINSRRQANQPMASGGLVADVAGRGISAAAIEKVIALVQVLVESE